MSDHRCVSLSLQKVHPWLLCRNRVAALVWYPSPPGFYFSVSLFFSAVLLTSIAILDSSSVVFTYLCQSTVRGC